VKLAEVSGAVELEDEEVLQFIERSKAANTVGSLARADPVLGKGVWSSAYTRVVPFPRIPGE
jgi:hypothetical protein